MFRTVPLPITSFSLYTQQWYMSYRFADSCPKTNLRNQCIYLGVIIRIYHDARSPERQEKFVTESPLLIVPLVLARAVHYRLHIPLSQTRKLSPTTGLSGPTKFRLRLGHVRRTLTLLAPSLSYCA